MRTLKSILRWLFGFQAAVLLLVPIAALENRFRTTPTLKGIHDPVPAAHLGIGIGVLVPALILGAVFAAAWWTTRAPSARRNRWALAASILYLAEGVTYFMVLHRHGRSSNSGLDLVAIGLAGLFTFARGESLPDLAHAPAKRSPIAGDRTSAFTRHAVTALSTLAQIAAIVFWSRWALTHSLFRTRGFTWLALITVGSILTTFVHECGHAVIAWCFEMGLLSFKAGPFQWRRRQGKWTFKFHPAGLLTPGGAVGAVPTHPDQPRWEETLVIAAGPAANLLLGLAAIYAVLYDRWGSYQQSWEFLAFTGSFSLIAAILNLFPFMSEDGAYSDGARILQILTHSPLDDYHRTMAAIASTVVTPRRYRDLDIAQIERAASLFPNELRGLHLLLCATHYYEDSGRLAEASASLAAAEAIYNNNSIDLPVPLHTIFILGHAWLNRNAAAARLWWDRMESRKRERSNVDYWLAKTALLWIEGNLHDAEVAWHEADLEAQCLPAFGAYEFDRSRCNLLRQALDHPSQPPAPASIPEAGTVIHPRNLTVDPPPRPAPQPVAAPQTPTPAPLPPQLAAPTPTILPAIAASAPDQSDNPVHRVLNSLGRLTPRPTAALPAAQVCLPTPSFNGEQTPAPTLSISAPGPVLPVSVPLPDGSLSPAARALITLGRMDPPPAPIPAKPAPAAAAPSPIAPAAIPAAIPAPSETPARLAATIPQPTPTLAPAIPAPASKPASLTPASLTPDSIDQAAARVLGALARAVPPPPGTPTAAPLAANPTPAPVPPPAPSSAAAAADQAAAGVLKSLARSVPPPAPPSAAAPNPPEPPTARPTPPPAPSAPAAAAPPPPAPAPTRTTQPPAPSAAAAPPAPAPPTRPTPPPAPTSASQDPFDQALARALGSFARPTPPSPKPDPDAAAFTPKPLPSLTPTPAVIGPPAPSRPAPAQAQTAVPSPAAPPDQPAVSAKPATPPPVQASPEMPIAPPSASAPALSTPPPSPATPNQLSRELIDQAAARLTNTLSRSAAPTQGSLNSEPPAQPTQPSPSTEIRSASPVAGSVTRLPASSYVVVTPKPETAPTPNPIESLLPPLPLRAPTPPAPAAPPASFTRIPTLADAPVSANWAPLPAAVASTFTPAPSTKAKAVPAAFARRSVRPVPAPPADPYAEAALAFTPPEPAEPEASTREIYIPPAFGIRDLPTPPAAAEQPRIDPLDFLRSPGELEKLLT